jgi:sec-independent protein translocase protein TatB
MFDFGVGYTELFVLAIIAAIVIGPKDLPKVLRTFGQFMSKARSMAREFQGHVDAAMRESGAETLKKDFQDFRKSVDDATKNSTVESKAAPSLTSSAQTDFARCFGPDAACGETRVAGTLVAVEAPAKP